MSSKYEYDVQKLYLEMMLSDAETFVRCQGIFDHTLFDRKLQEAAEFINEYTKTYSVMPDYEMVNASCRTNLRKPEEIKEGHSEWLMDEFENFTRHKALERAIVKSTELLEDKNYGEVESLIKEAVQIGLARDMGTDYFSDPRARLLTLKDKNGQVSTGWKDLDFKLYGGVNRGELIIFAAASGGGKSLFLANLSINSALAGLNVVYITLELSEPLVSMRMDSMLTGISTRDLFKDLDDVDLKVKMISKKAGTIQVKYIPSGKTANDIRSYIKEFEVKTGKKVDIIVVDYMDLLLPIGKKISAENLFVKDKYVSEELRNLAMEKNAVLYSAAQFNRGAVDEVEFDHSHISGGLSKIQTADTVMGIFTSRAMRERGQYQLQFLKTRNSSGVGQKIDLAFNIDTLRITDAEGDGEESAGARDRGGSSLLESIKRKATTNEATSDIIDPETGEVSPALGENKGKVKAVVQSSKLRDLLNNIDNEI